jgi:S1-C subfamily serine protease
MIMRIVALLTVLALVLPTWPRAALGEECGKSFTEIFREVSPAVVFITALSVNPFRLRDRMHAGVGAGFIVDAEGHVLTNSHVVYGSSAITVTLSNGGSLPAELLGADPILDLAVLKMPSVVRAFLGDFPTVTLGESDALEVGEEVIAVGNSFGLMQTVTRGIVSGLNRVLPQSPMSWMLPFIQTDAAVNPGNSGGPLVDRCGRVVGINTLAALEAENIGFAVPINIAKEVLPQLIEQGRVIRPWHGIFGKVVGGELRTLLNFPLVDGFLVETIEPGSPAEKIGLRGGTLPLRIGPEEYLLGGDIITKVNGESLSDMGTVIRVVRSLKVGDTVKLEYFREGETRSAEVVLPERPVLPGDLPPAERRSRTPLGGVPSVVPMAP